VITHVQEKYQLLVTDDTPSPS